MPFDNYCGLHDKPKCIIAAQFFAATFSFLFFFFVLHKVTQKQPMPQTDFELN
jgi:hypothetical protein